MRKDRKMDYLIALSGVCFIFFVCFFVLPYEGRFSIARKIESTYKRIQGRKTNNNNFDNALILKKEVDKIKINLKIKEDNMNHVKIKAKEDIEWVLSDDGVKK